MTDLKPFCDFKLLFNLGSRDRRRVCEAIAAACEKSYRRGFQHGTLADVPVMVDVGEWRRSPLDQSPSPHDPEGTGFQPCSLERHRREVGIPTGVVARAAESPLDDDDWNALGWICDYLEHDEPGMLRRLREIMEKFQ